MILRDLCGGEDADVYKALARDNLNRQYDFLTSIIRATLSAERMLGRSLDEKLTETIIKALNFHAVACLDHPAGTYRTTEVRVGPYNPPEASNVPRLMREFVSEANAMWDSADPVSLSAACLWVVNHIHPFVNGNGRTARALCYYVLCVKIGGFPGGDPILPELIRQNRAEYIQHLRFADAHRSVLPLRDFLRRLLQS